MKLTFSFAQLLFYMLFMLLLSACGMDHPSMVHHAFIYEKSNLDATNQGQIAVYYMKEDQLESYKWHQGYAEATLVRAFMDPDTLTVRRFEAVRVNDQGHERLGATLEAQKDNSLEIQAGDHHQRFEGTPQPWHSYDFDFASLGYAYRSLSKSEGPISFHILDFDLKETPPVFKDFGEVTMEFELEEDFASRQGLKYKIDGPGLDYRGGYIWFDKSDGLLLGFEIDKPDEPGYDSGKLLLKEVRQMNPTEWKQFKLRQLQSK